MFMDHNINVSMWVPVITADMQRLYVGYSEFNIVAIGKATDVVGLSKEFQEMFVKASQFGTLDRSCLMTTVK